MHKVLIIVMFAVIGCLLGGGLTFFSADGLDQLLYHCPSPQEKLLECGILFIFHGGLGALLGASLSVAIIAIREKKTTRAERP